MSLTLSPVLPLIRDSAYLRAVRAALPHGERPALSAIDAAKPALLAALHAAVDRPILVVTARPARARQLGEELRAWAPEPDRVLLFPEIEAFPYERLPLDPDTAATRREVLARLAMAPAGGPPLLIVTCVRAVLDRIMAPTAMRERALELRVGVTVRPDRLLGRLVALGYTRVPLVENPGEFARRGGIVDVYPAAPAVDDDGADGGAFRLDFFGDEIDSLRRLDPATQRSGEEAPGCLLAPAHEVLPPLEPTAAAAVAVL